MSVFVVRNKRLRLLLTFGPENRAGAVQQPPAGFEQRPQCVKQLLLQGGKLRDIGGAALVVSQFTLAADLRGNRPGFSTAAKPQEGKRLYEYFSDRLRAEGLPVENGIFGADMDVSLNNDGPVTIWMDI